MAYQPVTATHKIFGLKQRIRAVAGGTSASKTVSIIFWLIDYAQSHGPAKPTSWPPELQQRFVVCPPKLISIVSESYPHLEKGAMLDFEQIMKERRYWRDERWNATKHVYTFETGTKIEFFSVDTYGKAHGPRRDVLYVNECNNLEYGIVDQLITRTREIVWLDWNPSEEFWFYTDMQPNREDIDFLTVTYKDNEALDPITVAEIESHQHNKAWWQVYGLGRLGEVEGRVYTGWRIIDEIPFEARLERRGLDFGYSRDPAAVVDVYYHDGGFIFDQRLYQVGMSNRRLAQFLETLDNPNTLVYADSAEPKSIDELLELGIQVIPADKGPGSINRGIAFIQDQRISVTKRSVNLIKEYRKYMWMFDKNGKQLDKAEDGFDHALDAARYAMESLRPSDDEDEEAAYSTGNFISTW